jgi:hypothetical protein
MRLDLVTESEEVFRGQLVAIVEVLLNILPLQTDCDPTATVTRPTPRAVDGTPSTKNWTCSYPSCRGAHMYDRARCSGAFLRTQCAQRTFVAIAWQPRQGSRRIQGSVALGVCRQLFLFGVLHNDGASGAGFALGKQTISTQENRRVRLTLEAVRSAVLQECALACASVIDVPLPCLTGPCALLTAGVMLVSTKLEAPRSSKKRRSEVAVVESAERPVVPPVAAGAFRSLHILHAQNSMFDQPKFM